MKPTNLKNILNGSNKVRLAISKSDSNEYFIELNSENEDTFIVTHPQGIRCSVWKKYFKTKWVQASYEIKPLARPV